MSLHFRNLAKLLSLSSSPPAVEAGDIWWHGARSQVIASDGNAGIPLHVGPVGNVPIVRSGQWVTLPPRGDAGSVNVPDGRLFALPLWTGQACSLAGVAVDVTLALVGGNIRMGLYFSDGFIPTTLVQDFGTVSSGVVGTQQITGLSTPLRPVLYFLVVARQGGALNLGLTARNTNDPLVFSTSPLINSDLNTYYRDGVSGALPASFGAIVGSVQGPALSAQFS